MQVTPNESQQAHETDEGGLSLVEMLVPLAQNLRSLIAGPLLVGVLALGLTYLLPPLFTAQTTFLPPQQQQSSAASALASLGTLAGIAGGAAGLRSPADQYVSLLQSVTISDRIIDQFKLMSVYDKAYRIDTRRKLEENVRIGANKKDGMIAIEVDDRDPKRAAEMANRYVEELRRLTATLAVTEAQQRRAFFERQLGQTRDRLAQAQQALQASGFNPGALRTEPKAAAEAYARLRAEVTASEVRLQTLRGSLADQAPEVTAQQNALSALRGQLARVEQSADVGSGTDYVSKYREFKYQETLFDLFSRQYELARVDESREGALIQVVDPAIAPEKKSWPRRGVVAAGAALVTLLLYAGFLLTRHAWRQAASDPVQAASMQRLRASLGRRS